MHSTKDDYTLPGTSDFLGNNQGIPSSLCENQQRTTVHVCHNIVTILCVDRHKLYTLNAEPVVVVLASTNYNQCIDLYMENETVNTSEKSFTNQIKPVLCLIKDWTFKFCQNLNLAECVYRRVRIISLWASALTSAQKRGVGLQYVLSCDRM